MIKSIDLKSIRLQYQLTQQELAELMDVSVRTIQYYENDEHPIPKSRWDLLQFKLKEREHV